MNKHSLCQLVYFSISNSITTIDYTKTIVFRPFLRLLQGENCLLDGLLVGWFALLEGLAGIDCKKLDWPAYMAEGLTLAAWPRLNTGLSLAAGLSG